MQDSNLAWKIGGGLGALGVLLMGALAFNLGSLNQDVHGQRIIAAEKSKHENTHKMIKYCQDQLKAINEKDAQLVRESLAKEAEALLREKDIITTVLNELNDVVDECEADLSRVEEEMADVPKQQERVNELRQDNSQMQDSLDNANSTKEESRKELRRRVRALRLENEHLRRLKREKDIHDAERSGLEEKMARERKALQGHDHGLGEQGAEDDELGVLRSLGSRLSRYGRVKDHDSVLQHKTEFEDPDVVHRRRGKSLRRKTEDEEGGRARAQRYVKRKAAMREREEEEGDRYEDHKRSERTHRDESGDDEPRAPPRRKRRVVEDDREKEGEEEVRPPPRRRRQRYPRDESGS